MRGVTTCCTCGTPLWCTSASRRRAAHAWRHSPPSLPLPPTATLAAITDCYIEFSARNLGAVARSYAIAVLYPTAKVLGKHAMEDLVRQRPGPGPAMEHANCAVCAHD